MSCRYIPTENRDIPLRQPQDWKVRYPHFMVELPEHIQDIAVTYIGIQKRHEENPVLGDHENLKPHTASSSQKLASKAVEQWILSASKPNSPELWEKFYVEAGYDIPDTEVFVMYWFEKSIAETAIDGLRLDSVLKSLSSADQDTVGLWRESYIVPKLRLETVYNGNNYRPGLAALEDAELVSHSYTGYWGAARDRMPASAEDLLVPNSPPAIVDFTKDTKGRSIVGINHDSILHIRSGQFWARCPEDEKEAYESALEPVMRQGMAHLENNAAETGDFGLRFMRNLKTNRIAEAEEDNKSHHEAQVSSTGYPHRLETCSAGFFRSLKDIETWASKHPTHHKIFYGAHAHSTRFGKETFKQRAWHEVAVLKPGEVSFEYHNCHPRTGLLPFVDWDV